jgi:N-acetylglucosaminyldiphosphoundecaprenol N-acetyl-beta-D-mannosaminyltransferase
MKPALPPRIRIGGLPIDPLTFDGAIDAVDELVKARTGGSVFTPNVDHIVQFEENAELRRAYEKATLSLVDGMPVVWASRLLGTPLPEKISGSDLLMPLVHRAAARGWRVFLLGGADGAAVAAKAEMERLAPGVNVVGTLSPRIDLSQPPSARAAVVEAIRATQPDIIFVAFGAPKQELFIAEVQDALTPAVMLGIGASIDFVAGLIPRAPVWMAKSGLEWLYRLAREPRRLWRRYLVRDPKFALILARSFRDSPRA